MVLFEFDLHVKITKFTLAIKTLNQTFTNWYKTC